MKKIPIIITLVLFLIISIGFLGVNILKAAEVKLNYSNEERMALIKKITALLDDLRKQLVALQAEEAMNKLNKTENPNLNKKEVKKEIDTEDNFNDECRKVCMEERKSRPSIDLLNNQVNTRSGISVSVGENVLIEGKNLDLDKNDTKVMLDDKEMEILKFSPNALNFLVPDDFESGNYELHISNIFGQSDSFQINFTNPNFKPKVFLQSAKK